MSFWANIGGTWRKGTLWQNVGGTWRKGLVWQNVGGTWRKDTAASGGGTALVATVDNPSVYGSVSRAQATRVYTNTATALASGGTAPYAYSWSAEVDWQVESPTTASSRFSATVGPGGTQNATFTCTVTDAKGATATVQVQAEVDNYYSGGGGRADIQ